MKLTDFSLTPAQKMRDINAYLKESFGYSLNTDQFDQAKIARALEQLGKQQWDISCKVVNYQNDSRYTKSVMMAESLRLLAAKQPKRKTLSESVARLQLLLEQDLEQAEVALAAKSMAEDVKDMAEKIAKMQVETLMALVDTMKTTHGTQEAQQFNDTVEATLQTLLDTLKQSHDALSNAAAMVAGEEGVAPMDSTAPAPGGDMGMAGDESTAPEMGGEPNLGMAGADSASGPVGSATGRELK